MATAQDLKNYVDTNLPSNNAIKMSLLRSVLKYLLDNLYSSLGVGGSIAEVKDIIIEVGQIASNTLVSYINANDDTSWNLTDDSSYTFQCVRDGFLETYKYVGIKPKYLGLSQTTALDADFKLLHTGRVRAEGCWVEKANANTSLSLIQSGDKVYYKAVTDGALTIILFGHTYDSGNKGLVASYTQNQSITI